MAQTQGSLLEVLKKKMRAMKDELEAAKETTDDTQLRLQEEIRRREEVSLKNISIKLDDISQGTALPLPLNAINCF